MGFTKITPADLSGKGVVGLPDTPQLSALAMQQKFDEIANDVIVPKFNNLVDELENTGGYNMNVTDPTTSLTDTLQNTLNHIETENALNTADRHNHTNKATLDDIDALTKQGYDDVVTLLTGITAVETTALDNDPTKIPNNKVVDDTRASLQSQIDDNTAERHSHSNKSVLDAITGAMTTAWDALVTLFTGISAVEKTTLDSAVDKIPNDKVVKDAIDTVQAEVNLNTAARHTHTNKATLDAIDSTTKSNYDALVTAYGGSTIEQTVTNDANKVTSGAAVVAYVQSLGGGDMTKAVYDTNNDGTVDSADYATTAGYANNAGDSTKLGGLNSSAYAATTDLQKLFGDVATYQATSVALRNYAVGDFMIYENNFYEVTTAISSGGTIVKGAGGNITQTTVGAVLTALNGNMTGATALDNGAHGLVPAPSAGDEGKFLKGDGSWDNVPNPQDMTGATSLVAGSHGLVPAPAAGDDGKFLKGDGTWDDVPNPSDMTGATSLTPGTHGLVPAPAAGDENKVLKGNGTWGSADEATVRYDENTQYIQCKDSNGWFNWRKATREIWNALENTSLIKISKNSSATSPTVTLSNNTLKLEAGGNKYGQFYIEPQAQAYTVHFTGTATYTKTGTDYLGIGYCDSISNGVLSGATSMLTIYSNQTISYNDYSFEVPAGKYLFISVNDQNATVLEWNFTELYGV